MGVGAVSKPQGRSGEVVASRVRRLLSSCMYVRMTSTHVQINYAKRIKSLRLKDIHA